MYVTRQSSTVHGTKELFGHVPDVRELFPKVRETWRVCPPTKSQLIGFCDWVSMYQSHEGNLGRFSDGLVRCIDANGEIVSDTLKHFRVEGSFESAVFIRCDGNKVSFQGNVSKFGRRDNVFGYGFIQCVDRINDILHDLHLPPFTEGERYVSNFRSDPRSVWTGARVTRVDVTQNFETGSKENAYHFMRFLAGQQASRVKTSTMGDGETVDFGRGSRSMYFKVYSKAAELRRHAEANEYIGRLVDWCDSVGLVRAELTLKATKLQAMGCNYLGGFDMKTVESQFVKKCEVFSRASAEVEEITDLPKHLLSTYRMWAAGDDVVARLSRNTFYVHRRALLPFGVDIAIKSNVVPMKMKTRVIQLGQAFPPDWYELPLIERKHYGTDC